MRLWSLTRLIFYSTIVKVYFYPVYVRRILGVLLLLRSRRTSGHVNNFGMKCENQRKSSLYLNHFDILGFEGSPESSRSICYLGLRVGVGLEASGLSSIETDVAMSTLRPIGPFRFQAARPRQY